MSVIQPLFAMVSFAQNIFRPVGRMAVKSSGLLNFDRTVQKDAEADVCSPRIQAAGFYRVRFPTGWSL